MLDTRFISLSQLALSVLLEGRGYPYLNAPIRVNCYAFRLYGELTKKCIKPLKSYQRLLKGVDQRRKGKWGEVDQERVAFNYNFNVYKGLRSGYGFLELNSITYNGNRFIEDNTGPSCQNDGVLSIDSPLIDV